MLEVYSLDVNASANAPIPFQNVKLKKGCTAELSGVSTIKLNKCGVYMVSVDVTATDSTTIQLYKDGVAQPQTQRTGTNPSFETLVQVTENNSCCPCATGTNLQIMNTTATTLANANVVITKLV